MNVMLKPQKNTLVRDPITREQLKAAGELKPYNPYWIRRLNEGSVIQVEQKEQEQ